jgi:DNA-binding transcriptional ArsR family regulator
LELIATPPTDTCTSPEAQAVLRALAEPSRLEILKLVWSRELSAGHIAAEFHLTRTSISEHLRIMESVGLLERRKKGSLRLYRARPQRLAQLWAFFETLD